MDIETIYGIDAEGKDFLVVIRDAKFPGQNVPDGASAATELPAYVDDEIIHNACCFLSGKGNCRRSGACGLQG